MSSYYARWLEGGMITVDLQNMTEVFRRVVSKCTMMNSYPNTHSLGAEMQRKINKETWMEDQSVKLVCRLAFLAALRG